MCKAHVNTLPYRVDKMMGLIANQIFPNKKIVVGQILDAEVHGVNIKYAQVWCCPPLLAATTKFLRLMPG